MEQLSLFESSTESGRYVESHGARLTWGELRAGMTVVYDCSTQSHAWFRLAVVDSIIRTPDDWRVILRCGRSRPLINRQYIDNGSCKLYKQEGLTAGEENCHGCKWLDETRPQGTGYCCTVQRSQDYHTMPCVIDCGHRAPEIRRPELQRCELYATGNFKTRFEKGD